MNIKACIKQLEARKIALGKERDRIRSLADELSDLEMVSQEAYESLEQAIDRLSELV